MATIINRQGNEYLLTFSLPETGWISDLANCMGIAKESVVAAAINKGLCHYVESLLRDDVIDKVTRLAKGEILPENGGQ